MLYPDTLSQLKFYTNELKISKRVVSFFVEYDRDGRSLQWGQGAEALASQARALGNQIPSRPGRSFSGVECSASRQKRGDVLYTGGRFPPREGTPAAHQQPALPRPGVGGICGADTKPSGRGGAEACVAEVTPLVQYAAEAMPRASYRGGAVAGPPSRAQDDGSLQNDTSHMSFEELLELQSQVGTKAYKQLVTGSSTKKQSCRPPVQKACVADKHRPLEMSAKVRVPFLRQVVPISKKVARDPRFDDLSGEYNPEVFDKTYQFLDDIRAREKELVKKQLKKRRSGEEHEKLQHLLQRMEQQEMAQKERKRQQELRLALKQERRAQAQQGHRPYFLKKSEQRQLVLAEKFKELKRSKKLESFLSRKRRRNAGKDRRHLPLSKE